MTGSVQIVWKYVERLNAVCLVFMSAFVVQLVSCKPTNTVTPGRTYRMGFQNSAPRLDFNKDLQALAMWTQRADAAIISNQIPWDSLYAGVTPQQYVTNNYIGLVNYYRNKNLKLWLYIDPANGLDRSADAADLVALGNSIAQPSVQQLYTRFCIVADSMVRPDHMGLALETNLIRSLSPDSIYAGVKSAASAAASTIAAFDSHVLLSVSVQADWAWGSQGSGIYQGVEQDFSDFSFIKELGISSYPYFAYDLPQNIPSGYYSRLLNGRSMPVFVSEGGWSSQTVGTYQETQQKQQDYITRQGQLLDEAKALAIFQLTFTDINLNALPSGTPANLNQFAYIGLVDTNLQAKQGLATWDQLFKRSLTPGH